MIVAHGCDEAERPCWANFTGLRFPVLTLTLMLMLRFECRSEMQAEFVGLHCARVPELAVVEGQTQGVSYAHYSMLFADARHTRTALSISSF